MCPTFCSKSWTHIGLILDSYWTHWLFDISHLSPACADANHNVATGPLKK